MKVIEFQDEDYIKSYLKDCEWDAGKFLYSLIQENKRNVLGWNHVYVLLDEQKVISFCTLSQKDCIDDDALIPWIGFVYTQEEYRGHRYSQKVIDAALEEAKKLGYTRVYLATDHIGFYEKYGFIYLESRIDIYNEESRIYYYNL